MYRYKMRNFYNLWKHTIKEWGRERINQEAVAFESEKRKEHL